MFDPATRAVTVPPGSQTADFVGKCFIAGHVRTLAGAPIPTVTVGLYQGGILKVSSVTDANGRYYFINLATGSYTVQPMPNGHVFSPEYTVVAVPPGSSTTDFIGTGSTSTISGVIRTAGGAPIFGMSVRLYQGVDLKASVSTNSEGRYTFSGVPYGSYTVRPMSNVTAFSPATRDVTIPPDATDVDFTGSYALVGTVKTAGGAAVPALPARNTTNIEPDGSSSSGTCVTAPSADHSGSSRRVPVSGSHASGRAPATRNATTLRTAALPELARK